jgi:aspartate aminotransferase
VTKVVGVCVFRAPLQPGAIRSGITQKQKMMWFSSPCNPRICLTEEELTALAMLEKYPHVYVVADEIYEHINFSGTFAALHLSGM